MGAQDGMNELVHMHCSHKSAHSCRGGNAPVWLELGVPVCEEDGVPVCEAEGVPAAEAGETSRGYRVR